MLRLLKLLVSGLILLLFLQQSESCKGGHGLSLAERKRHDSLEKFPYWISMMDSPNVNYYKTVEAFDIYWEHRERPTENDGEAHDIYGKTKTKEEQEKEAKRSVQYVYEYKQFLNWQQKNKNLVKPDGTIMTSEEILEQWKKSKNDSTQR